MLSDFPRSLSSKYRRLELLENLRDMGRLNFVQIFTLVVVTFVGILIGFLFAILFPLKKCKSIDDEQEFRIPAINNQTLIGQILDQVKAGNLRTNLRILASKPHLAGLERDKELVDYIKQKWLQDGLDSVETVPYNVLLSYPNPKKPNKVKLLNEDGITIHQSSHMEDILRIQDSDPNFVHAFNAYAPNGSAFGDLVYVNYASVEDFQFLDKLGVNVSGKICFARNGLIFRGNKLSNSEKRGAIGLILFSDPHDVSVEGLEKEKVYPNTIMLPSSGIQRGAVFTDIGDPLTPHWPSINGAYRIPKNQALLPKIPCQPISYKDAEKFLRILGGQEVPDEWRGYHNLPFKIGPGFVDNHRNKRILLEVHNVMKQVTVHNVIGKLKGSFEPDRYVIQGNHRDAWGFGAVDPSSGTAQLMENVRVFGELAKNGWRPRRSLMFGSWAAEEYAVIGTQEWVEENVNKLMDRAVGYVNTDVCVSGPNLEISASPLLTKMVLRATKMVKSPLNSSLSVYDKWVSTFPDGTKDNDMIFGVGAGSDLAPFAFYAGIPVADIWFRIDQEKYNMSIYPSYHTGYDTLYLMETFIDPDFKIHRSCSQLALVMMLDMSDSVLLPLTPRDLASSMEKSFKQLQESLITKQLESHGISTSYLAEAINNFSLAAKEWESRLRDTKLSNSLLVRSLNDQLMEVERSFILPGGLPGRPNTRHVLFSPSVFDAYSSSAFPGISDLLYAMQKPNISLIEETKLKGDLEKHITEVMVQINQASSALKPV